MQSEPGAALQRAHQKMLSIFSPLLHLLVLCLHYHQWRWFYCFTLYNNTCLSHKPDWHPRDCLLEQVKILQDLLMRYSNSCPLWVEQCLWDSTQRGRFSLQRTSCDCNRWSCFRKASGESCCQIDSFLGLISTFSFFFAAICCSGFEKICKKGLPQHS